ncbi:MAG: MerR family transcriptional regulator [Candidatus Kapabacteria bacterium]|jgi:DNA-binding transcriptional MerR regulator|nr:MerR family transcriptional regulator [Candidatus Kapabacteria bacterium]
MKTTGYYTVSTVASLAGVSVRTLHHYDACGLLRPSIRSEAGYRLYSFDDLLRLQQILVYRAMNVPLDTIAVLLVSEEQDVIKILEHHRQIIEQEVARLQQIHATISSTIQSIEDTTMPTDERSLYEGLGAETIEAYRREVEARFDPGLIEESRNRTMRMSTSDWRRSKEEWNALLRDYASAMDQGAGSMVVQNIVARHHRWLAGYWTPQAASFEGLGELYATHGDFVKRIDQVRPGLAAFIRVAMAIYARTEMKSPTE